MAKKNFFKTTSKVVGTLVVVLVLLMAVVGCASTQSKTFSDDNLLGTWMNNSMEIIFHNDYSGDLRLYKDTGKIEAAGKIKYSAGGTALTMPDGTRYSAVVEGDVLSILGLGDEPVKLHKVSKVNAWEGTWRWADDDGSVSQVLVFNPDGSGSWNLVQADGTELFSGSFTYRPFGVIVRMDALIRGQQRAGATIKFLLDNNDFNKLVVTNAMLPGRNYVFERQ